MSDNPTPSDIARGSNASKNGNIFEEKTNNKTRMLKNGAQKIKIPNHKSHFYLRQDLGNGKILIHVKQSAFKTYMKHYYNIEYFRNPDEAYIIEEGERLTIKILEKKFQKVEGSVETKLWAGHGMKREFEIITGEIATIHYGFCVSDFLQNKFSSKEQKYTVLKRILKESSIDILFGNDENYFEKLDEWIRA